MLIRALSLFLYSGLALAAGGPTFPALTYSTYLRDNFTPMAISTDPSGNIYMAGSATVDPSISETTVLVVKLNPQATQYLYVRFLGGSVYDSASAIAVDGAGNAYVAGTTGSPDFPVTSGGNLGTAPAGLTGERSFVTKLDSNGEVVFSDLLGGSTISHAHAIAVNASGQILVSGTSVSSGFPTTGGAYSVSNSANHPYLLKLDATGTKIVFSATGIGGTAIALDSSGNIYVAGSTYLLDYPTTTGAYQAIFPTVNNPPAPGQPPTQGANQFVTKVDPDGATLIFSTSVSGIGNTTNAGLAVDASGNVYLTGFAGAGYPYTVTAPAPPAPPSFDFGSISALPFLSKLNPTGQKLLFSVPVGGAGVQVDSNGSAYVGGVLGFLAEGPNPLSINYLVASDIPALGNVPAQCLPNTRQESAYVSQVDAASGNVLGTQFIGGSTPAVSGVTLSGSKLWLAGATNFPDFPFSPDALSLSSPYFSNSFVPGALPGAYLGAVDFSQPQPPEGTPQIGCIVDAADLADAGPVAPSQLLTIFGTGLGPSTVSATDYSTTTLAGVTVSFGSTLAPLLYVSPTQINFAVPFGYIFPASAANPASGAMQVTVNGESSPPLGLPSAYVNPSLFSLALNADGSVNSPTNPAHLGSMIVVFVNGLSNGFVTDPPQLSSNGGWSVTNIAQENPFVLQVDIQAPSTIPHGSDCSPLTGVCYVGFEIYNINASGPGSLSGQTLSGVVSLTGPQ
jgi:uncharacterized protein (TIGR03437 family)